MRGGYRDPHDSLLSDFLFCEEDGQGAVYIGEAENVLERLNGHLRDYQAGKESYYWTTAVALGRTSNGNVDWKTKEGTKLKDL